MDSNGEQEDDDEAEYKIEITLRNCIYNPVLIKDVNDLTNQVEVIVKKNIVNISDYDHLTIFLEGTLNGKQIDQLVKSVFVFYQWKLNK